MVFNSGTDNTEVIIVFWIYNKKNNKNTGQKG
jgi:hypothetical protein